MAISGDRKHLIYLGAFTTLVLASIPLWQSHIVPLLTDATAPGNSYDPTADGAGEMVLTNDKAFPKPMNEIWSEEQFSERRGDPSGECPASPTGLHSAGFVSRYVKVIYDTYEHRISGGTRGIMGTDSLYCTFCWQRMSR